MAKLKEIVFDARHPAGLARFWAGAIDGYTVRAYDAAEIARLAARGLTPETDTSVAVDGPGPTLFMQRVAQVREHPGTIHLDLACASRAAEAARLVALGARVRDVLATHTVMLDPEGNRFCLQGPA